MALAWTSLFPPATLLPPPRSPSGSLGSSGFVIVVKGCQGCQGVPGLLPSPSPSRQLHSPPASEAEGSLWGGRKGRVRVRGKPWDSLEHKPEGLCHSPPSGSCKMDDSGRTQLQNSGPEWGSQTSPLSVVPPPHFLQTRKLRPRRHQCAHCHRALWGSPGQPPNYPALIPGTALPPHPTASPFISSLITRPHLKSHPTFLGEGKQQG